MNLVSSLLKAASDGKSGITFVQATGSEERISYSDLYQTSLRVLHALQQKGVGTGDELVIQVDEDKWLLCLFWACLLGGIRAVPISPGQQAEQRKRLFSVWRYLDRPFLVCDEKQFERVSANRQDADAVKAAGIGRDKIILLTELFGGDREGKCEPVADADLAYIQFSSGSTGDPKGVMLTHDSLSCNVEDILTSLKITGNDVLLSWMPLTHDMGIIGFHLCGVVKNIDAVSIPTQSFIRRPLLWMDKVAEHRASVLYSPNFGLHYFLSALRKKEAAGWDLSCIRILVNGAEPISIQLCEQFASALEKYGMRTHPFVAAYGLAEACVEVSAMPPGTSIRSYPLRREFLNPGQQIRITDVGDPAAAIFADVGYPVDSCQIRISDDRDMALPEDTVGHIQIRGRNVTGGYYNHPSATLALFTEDDWLRTGDLGFMREGRLVITGRQKNIILVNGQNYYPQDIERVIIEAGKAELGKVVACGTDTLRGDEGDLILFCLYKGSQEEFAPVAREIRESVLASTGLYAGAIVPVKKIPKTTSGKIQHFLLLEQYRNGEVGASGMGERKLADQSGATILPEAIPEKLLEIGQALLGRRDLDLQTDLFEAGMNSLTAIRLAGRIQQETGFKTGIEDIFRHSTIDGIGRFLLTAKKEESLPSFQRTAPADHAELSAAQKRIWTEQQFDKDSVAYNIPVMFKLRGVFDAGKLEASVKGLIQKYELLRTSFYLQEDTPMQRIHPYTEALFSMGYDDLRQLTNRLEKGMDICKKAANIPFALDRPCQLRLRAIRVSENEYYLVLTIHHILADGWSMARLLQELCSLYNTTAQQQAAEEPPVQFRDYVYWQSEMLLHPKMAEDIGYWTEELRGLPGPADLSNRRKPPVREVAFPVNRYDRFLPMEDLVLLRGLAATFDTTPFGILMSLLNVLIYRYTDQKDLVLAFDTAGRLPGRMEELIGYTLNTLFLRTTVSGEIAFAEVVTTVREKLLAAIDHQWYPFEKMLENKEINGTRTEGSLFTLLVLYQNFYEKDFELELTGCEIAQEPLFVIDGFTDLQLEFNEKKEGLQLSIQYRDTLFNGGEMQQLADHLQNLLHAVAADSTAKISSYNLLTDMERKFLQPAVENNPDQRSPKIPIHALFERRAANFPDALAVCAGNTRLSYRELNNRANGVAHFLKSRYSIRPEDRIGFLVARNENIVIAMLAILKTSAAYVALDPDLPPGRCEQIVADSGLKVVLTDNSFFSTLTETFGPDLPVDMDDPDLYATPAADLLNEGTMDSLAYIIYTSGSTGRPKGVMIEHRSLSEYVRYFIDYFEIDSTDVFIQQASVGFDTIIEEVFPALCSSGRIVIAEKGGRDIEELLSLIFRNNVTVLSTTPTVLKEINSQVDSRLASLRLVISGGEALHPAHINNILDNVEIFNTYGPCEATVCATYKRINSLPDALLIGNPICHHRIYILDENRQLLPWGRRGEIYIEGGLARGYLNLPGLTEEKFVVSPFDPGKRLFRTGDGGRFTATGEIEFLGRTDHQFKIRGYRIEPEEIEYVISRHPRVIMSVVVPGINGQQLFAYLTVEKDFSTDDLRIAISRDLPSYMIPARFEIIDRMPLTTTGKIDRMGLQDRAARVEGSVPVLAAAVSPLQELLLDIIKQVLSIEKMGITDNFFEAGCNSIKATRIIGLIHKELHYRIGIREMFVYPTVALLADRLTDLNKRSYQQLPAIGRAATYELSPSQKRLWLLSRIDKRSFACNEGEIYEIEGEIDAEKVRMAFKLLVNRHEILRTVFREVDDLPRQVILDSRPDLPGFCYTDLAGRTDAQSRAEEMLFEEARCVFDLEQGPLYRILLLRVAPGRCLAAVIMHHIITDDWSARLLINEFLRTYEAIDKGSPILTGPPKLQYKDYAGWMNAQLRRNGTDKEGEYWNRLFADGIPVLDLSPDYTRPAVKSYEGSTLHAAFGEVLLPLLENFSQEGNASLFMTLLCGLTVLLSKHSGQSDLVIGSPVAGREHPDLDNMLGFFVNLVPFRMRFDPKDRLSTLLQRTRQVCLDAYEHQAYPFDQLIRDLAVSRDLSRSPVFDVLLNLRDRSKSEVRSDTNGIRFNQRNRVAVGSKYDLSFYFERQENTLTLSVEYDHHLFSADRIHRMIAHYKNILTAMTADVLIEDLDYLTAAEKKQLPVHTLPSRVSVPDTGIPELFHRRAAEMANKCCIRCEERSLSYQEVDEQAERLACLLAEEYGIKENDTVGLLLDRSEKVVIAILAVWKAGAHYVPIDLDAPVNRMAFIIRDAGVKIVLTDIGNLALCEQAGKLGSFPVAVVDLAGKPGEFIRPSGRDSAGVQIAYVMYTSGSTGEPKAVEVYHHSILNVLYCLKEQPGFDHRDRMLSVSTSLFDISVTEFFLPLVTGGELVIATKEEVMDTRKLTALIDGCRPTYMQATPALWNALADADWQGHTGLKAITCGEALTEQLATKLLSRTGQLWNLYGPTEATIFATGKRILAANERISIGYPLANTTLYITDEAKKLVPSGVYGEIHIGGRGVAKGYLNRPELTQQRFIEDLPVFPERVYASGDIGRWLPDGTVEYRGRRDHQVKIRGYRIEIGEVESCVRKYAALRSAAVIVHEGGKKDKKMVLFAVDSGDHPATEEGLRKHLQERLPGYMIPSLFIWLDEMPLTTSGKIDRKALAEKDLSLLVAADKKEIVPAATSAEKLLLAIWQDLLERKDISINDNFFDLGGHSLSANQLVNRIGRQTGIEMGLADIFNFPTVRAMGGILTKLENDKYDYVELV
ncbi:amino acid adenylation domain-containing protein [Puia sp.]|uniref:amino acid adenylation domain-containing protein n=1 Tax=Puia sp. TaxID=2045100 RepID=UPI002F3F0248